VERSGIEGLRAGVVEEGGKTDWETGRGGGISSAISIMFTLSLLKGSMSWGFVLIK